MQERWQNTLEKYVRIVFVKPGCVKGKFKRKFRDNMRDIGYVRKGIIVP